MEEIFKKIKKIHFIGIGGSGMSGIAEVLLNLGYKVSGSDIKDSEVIQKLKSLGAKIVLKHKSENIKDADVVVYSSAITDDNPEIIAAKKKNIPVIPRIEMLAEIARMKYTISVCGTHGKTTTTSMIGLVFDYCGYDPTIVVGGKVKNIGSSAKLGKGKFIIVESDESDGSFLHLSPYMVICTNIDDDHLDHYKNIHNLKEAFLQHFNSVPFYGFNVLYGDDKNIRSLLNKIHRKYYTYGLSDTNNFVAKDVVLSNTGSTFKVYYNSKLLGKMKLKIVGLHNVLNALSVVSCCIICGFEFNKISSVLEQFIGVERRLEFKGVVYIDNKKIEVYDDYGHHPTEISFTLKALKVKTKNKKIIILFQPHRYSRTKLLYKKFVSAFSKNEKILLLDIYPANEKPIKGVTSKLIYDELRKNGFDVEMYNHKRLIELLKYYGDQCVVLTLGAGNVYKIGESLVQQYGN